MNAKSFSLLFYFHFHFHFHFIFIRILVISFFVSSEENIQLNGKPNFGLIFSDILSQENEISERRKRRKSKVEKESMVNLMTVINSTEKPKKDPTRKVSFLSEEREDKGEEEEGEGERGEEGERKEEKEGEIEISVGDDNKASSLVPFSSSFRNASHDSVHLKKGKGEGKLTVIEMDREEKRKEKERIEVRNFNDSKVLMKNMKRRDEQVGLAFSRCEFVDLVEEVMRNTFHNLFLENLNGEFQIMSESIQFLSKKDQLID